MTRAADLILPVAVSVVGLSAVGLAVLLMPVSSLAAVIRRADRVLAATSPRRPR